MINLNYIDDYYQKYKNLCETGLYSKYFAYKNIDTLYYSILDENDKTGSYWNDSNKKQYQSKLIECLTSFIEIDKLEEYCQFGCYADIFIKEYLNKNIKNQLIIDNKLYLELLSLYNEANLKTTPVKYGYEYIINDLSGLFILKLVSQKGKDQIKKITNSFINDVLECEVCNKKYKAIKFPKWLFYRVNGNIGVCYSCSQPIFSREQVLDSIRNIIQIVGFIPNSGFQNFPDNSFSIRVNNDNWISVYKEILNLSPNFSGIDYIKNEFGSWFQALVYAGVLDKGQIITKRGIKCLSKSGNICNSISEQYIDNLFFENNFKYQKEPHYPIDIEFNPKGLMKADWKIGNVYVEYFGLKGEINYDIKMAKKMRLCKKMNIELIAIFPDDLKNMSKILNNIKSISF